MNMEAIVVNNKYCVIQKDGKYHILIKKNSDIDFESLLVLENHLEEEKEYLKMIKKELENNGHNSQFYLLMGIVSLISTSIMIDKMGFKEPILAPLTMASCATLKTIKLWLKHCTLKNKVTIIEANVGRIHNNYILLKERAKLEDQELEFSIDNNVLNCEQLHNILKSYLQEEIITSEKHLLLKI